MRKEYFLNPKSQEKVWNEKWIFAEIEKEIYEAKNSPVIEIIEKFLPLSGRILDAGCGIGGYLIYLRSKGYDVYGIDFSKEAISKLKLYDSSLKVKVANCENLPFPEHYFDLYISLGVLEHIEHGYSNALKEAYRVLKKDGIIIISIPWMNIYRLLKDFVLFKVIRKKHYFIYTLEGDRNRILYTKNFFKEDTGFFQYYFTSLEVKKLFKKNQFEIIYWKPYSVLPGILEVNFLRKVYKKFVLQKSKNNLHKVNIEVSKNRKKISFFFLSFIFIKKIYKLLSWENPKNLIEETILKVFRYLFGHMVLIVGIKKGK